MIRARLKEFLLIADVEKKALALRELLDDIRADIATDPLAEYRGPDGAVLYQTEHARWVQRGDYIQAGHGDTEWEPVVSTVHADSQTGIVTMTATEGGYCFDQGTGELDFNHPGNKNDLANPNKPQTIFGYLSEGLKRRRDAGVKPFTVLSCDNLQHNGEVRKRTLLAFCAKKDADLRGADLTGVLFLTPRQRAAARH